MPDNGLLGRCPTKTNSPCFALASVLRIAMVRLDNGTRCSRPAFMRAAGTEGRWHPRPVKAIKAWREAAGIGKGPLFRWSGVTPLRRGSTVDTDKWILTKSRPQES